MGDDFVVLTIVVVVIVIVVVVGRTCQRCLVRPAGCSLPLKVKLASDA